MLKVEDKVVLFFFLMVLCVGSCVCSRFRMEKRSLVTIVSQTDVLRTPVKYGGRNERHTEMTRKSLSCTFIIIKSILLRKAAL